MVAANPSLAANLVQAVHLNPQALQAVAVNLNLQAHLVVALPSQVEVHRAQLALLQVAQLSQVVLLQVGAPPNHQALPLVAVLPNLLVAHHSLVALLAVVHLSQAALKVEVHLSQEAALRNLQALLQVVALLNLQARPLVAHQSQAGLHLAEGLLNLQVRRLAPLRSQVQARLNLLAHNLHLEKVLQHRLLHKSLKATLRSQALHHLNLQVKLQSPVAAPNNLVAPPANLVAILLSRVMLLSLQSLVVHL